MEATAVGVLLATGGATSEQADASRRNAHIEEVSSFTLAA